MLPLVAEASTVPGKGVNMAEGSTGVYLSRVFPYKDDNPTILTPVVTVGIIALNLAAWIFLQGAGAEGPLARSVCELGLIPGEVLGTVPPGTAVPLGPGVHCVTTGAPHRGTALTSLFMHGGRFHGAGNLWVLA